MKKSLLFALSMAVAGVSLSTLPLTADAKRLGGGRPAGMQRQAPPAKPANQATPNTPQQAAPAQAPATPAAPAAAPGKRSWLGPIAGLAAGLGLAALMSHLGLGAAFGNIITMLLLAVVAFIAIRWAMRRFGGGSARATQPMSFGGPQMAGAAAGVGGGAATPAWTGNAATPLNAPLAKASQANDVALPPLQPVLRTPESLGSASQFGPDASHLAAPLLPPGVDAAAFERLAKMVFIRLQAANDAGAVDDLRKFTTPELFASLRLDLQERGKQAQQTDVVELDAQLVDTAQEGGQWIASVRFRGLIREEAGAEAAPFDELWHLVKPLDDSRPDAQQWAIAGITPQG
ncbi:MAG: TIM44-like domain-containing protein [Burkholderiales bacterium]